ncbi:MAG: hypothetical protein ACLQT7_07305 [Candidatus Dormibacteria bacterium]
MSDSEALGWALQAAQAATEQAATEQAAPPARAGAERVARAGSAAVEALLSCESLPAWRLQMPGVPDPMRAARHEVRSAAQMVLGQLELIGLAWDSWDAATREEMLGELEEASRQLAEDAGRFTGDAA